MTVWPIHTCMHTYLHTVPTYIHAYTPTDVPIPTYLTYAQWHTDIGTGPMTHVQGQQHIDIRAPAWIHWYKPIGIHTLACTHWLAMIVMPAWHTLIDARLLTCIDKCDINTAYTNWNILSDMRIPTILLDIRWQTYIDSHALIHTYPCMQSRMHRYMPRTFEYMHRIHCVHT